MKATTDTHATVEELLEAAFSMRSVPRLCNECQLQLENSLDATLRIVGGWCEMAASLGVSSNSELVVGYSSAGKNVSTEAEEATAFGICCQAKTSEDITD
jgi:hypothetical protein